MSLPFRVRCRARKPSERLHARTGLVMDVITWLFSHALFNNCGIEVFSRVNIAIVNSVSDMLPSRKCGLCKLMLGRSGEQGSRQKMANGVCQHERALMHVQ